MEAAGMTPAKSTRATEVPLYVIPHAIRQLLRKRGENVYRISVVRTRYHHYNISLRTRSLPKELMPARNDLPAHNVPQVHSDEDGEGGVA
jgi:hypothetical protein